MEEAMRVRRQGGAENREEFSPMEALGPDLFSQIHTLPESIYELKNVKKVWLYGSSLKKIPPEIGGMESLEYFDPYTSYDLHWFPYEITRCKNLKQSRISTRALYGNFKNRMGFSNLKNNPVRYFDYTAAFPDCIQGFLGGLNNSSIMNVKVYPCIQVYTKLVINKSTNCYLAAKV